MVAISIGLREENSSNQKKQINPRLARVVFWRAKQAATFQSDPATESIKKKEHTRRFSKDELSSGRENIFTACGVTLLAKKVFRAVTIGRPRKMAFFNWPVCPCRRPNVARKDSVSLEGGSSEGQKEIKRRNKKG